MTTYSDEYLLAKLKDFYKDNNRSPCIKDFRNGSPSVKTFQRRFGSWNNAIITAGLKTTDTKIWDKDLIIKAIKDFYIKYNYVPTEKDFQNNPSNTTVRRYFGSWNKAIEEAGFAANYTSKWNKETIIEKIKNFYYLNNRIPQMRDFYGNDNYPSKNTVAYHFGSWNSAITKSGFIAVYGGYGAPTVAKDGILYRSKAEAYFVDNFLFEKYQYEYELEYSNSTKWKYDFYLLELDLYIELTDLINPNRIFEKIEFNKRNNINCKIILIEDIYTKNFTLEGVLKNE